MRVCRDGGKGGGVRCEGGEGNEGNRQTSPTGGK